MGGKVEYDHDLESQANAILQGIGTDMKITYECILMKIVNKELSLEDLQKLTKPVNEKRPASELYGFLEGKLWISDDFNEPLDCMKEYME
ncbi:MAG: DUF2281 domain-containing protein [Candidatus Cloacimonetes bacterium]|nr:DUF2281 domain-containing protein [Candidatus Cloacimonadota bacterium]